jgi:hypothetical protein
MRGGVAAGPHDSFPMVTAVGLSWERTPPAALLEFIVGGIWTMRGEAGPKALWRAGCHCKEAASQREGRSLRIVPDPNASRSNRYLLHRLRLSWLQRAAKTGADSAAKLSPASNPFGRGFV